MATILNRYYILSEDVLPLPYGEVRTELYTFDSLIKDFKTTSLNLRKSTASGTATSQADTRNERKLCTFKGVSIKGELYSSDFNQHFMADGAVFSINQDTEGKV